MRTPFGYIQTDGRRRIDQLADVEMAQTRRVGDSLAAIARDFRQARTVGDVLDLEQKVMKLSGADDEPASSEPANDERGTPATLTSPSQSPAAALYGFMGWLTSRETASGPFSATHGASEAAELVDAFCRSQLYPAPAEGWQHGLNPYPSDVRAIGFDEALHELQAAGHIEPRRSDVAQHDEVIVPTGGAASTAADEHDASRQGNEPPAPPAGA